MTICSSFRAIAHSRGSANARRITAGGLTAAWLIAAMGCAAHRQAPVASERDSGSKPINEVRDRATRDRARAAATDPTDPAQGDPLANWIASAEADGLLTPSEQPKHRFSRARPAPSPLPEHKSDPAPGFSPPEPEPSGGVETVEAESLPLIAARLEPALTSELQTGTNGANLPLDLSNEPSSAGTTAAPDPVAESRPLAALVKLHAARTAGDASVSDEQIVALERALNAHEADFYRAWKALNQSVVSSASAGADADELKRAAEKFAQSARQWVPLRLPKAILCTRVEGFGMYQELRRSSSAAAGSASEAAYTFLAGRRNKFIVYCEVDGFTSAPASPAGAEGASTTKTAGQSSAPGGYEVRLAQDLTLYTASTSRDVIAWRKQDQRIKDISRNQRRDFFIVQVVELPETLSVGAYVLKVRIRDLQGTGEPQAEAVIPIDIVADDSAMR